MLNLGKRHMADPQLELVSISVPVSDSYFPSRMPVLADDKVVVSGIRYIGGYEVLTVCESLQDMIGERAWYDCAQGAIGISWYAGDKIACEAVVRNKPVAAV